MYSQIPALFDRTFWKEDAAVTSIEYAMLDSPIAVGIFGSVGLVGQNAIGLWLRIQQCVSFAVNQSGSWP